MKQTQIVQVKHTILLQMKLMNLKLLFVMQLEIVLMKQH